MSETIVTLTIDQLLTPMTPAVIKAKIYDVLARLNVSTTNWKPGGVVRLMIAASSIVLAGLSVLISLVARSAFLATSTGDWLTLVARHTFGVERELATFATGSVTLMNTLGGSFDYGPDEVVFSNTVTGKTYRNTEAFTLALGQQVTIAVRADEAGSASSTGPGTITTIVTTMIGVTCSNAGSLIGTDDETDNALIARCYLKPQSLSPNGARGAYETFAKKATRTDGTNVGINRVSVSPSSMTGQVTVTVATPSGAVSGTQGNPATDLGAVYAKLTTTCLPQAVTLTVQSATVRLVNVQFLAYFKRLVIPASEQERIARPAVEQWFATQNDIGGTTIPGVVSNKVLRDTLRDIISDAFAVSGTRPDLVVIYSPSGDLTLGADEVAEPGSVLAEAA